MDLLGLLGGLDTKTSRLCGEVKPLDEFNRDKRAKDGRKSRCRDCASRRSREHRERNRSRGTVDYPAGRLCSRCGRWGVVVLDPNTGKPSVKLGSDWGVDSSQSDGLRGVCRHCHQPPEKRRPRRLQSCPDCDDQEPRPLTNFGRVLHDDGTESYSEFCRLHHMARGGTKPCSKCGAWQPMAAYYGDAGSPDRLYSKCRDCEAAYYAENREAIAARNATYYAENREARAAQKAAYRAENREARAAYMAAYRRTDHGRAANAANNHRRRAREYLSDCGCVDGPALEAVKALNNGRCVYCDAPADTVEHLAALSNGDGLNCVSALVPSCGSCNSARQHRPLREFAESRGVNIDDLWAMTMTCDRWDEGTVSTV